MLRRAVCFLVHCGGPGADQAAAGCSGERGWDSGTTARTGTDHAAIALLQTVAIATPTAAPAATAAAAAPVAENSTDASSTAKLAQAEDGRWQTDQP